MRSARIGGQLRIAAEIVVVTFVLISLVSSIALGSVGWTGPTGVDSTKLSAVSCATATMCVATDASGQASTYNGAIWSAPGSTGSGDAINSISCTSASFCLATDSGSNWLTYNGSIWSAPSRTGTPNVINSVSCSSTTLCTAVDNDGYALTYNGSIWSSPELIDLSAPLFSVACIAGSSTCIAVGGAGVNGGTSGGAWISNGGPWSEMTVNDPVAVLAAVSCWTQSFCVAVDTAGNAFTYDGTQWSAPDNIDSPNQFSSVSCSSTTFCVAVDTAGNALVYNGDVWSAPAKIDDQGSPTSVSCAPATLTCTAVDGGGNVLTYAPEQHTLSVTERKRGGSGAIYGPNFTCACSVARVYPAGQQVSMTVVPGGSSAFVGWSGACTGRGTCEVTMNSDQAVTATFRAGCDIPIHPPHIRGWKDLSMDVFVASRLVANIGSVALKSSYLRVDFVYPRPNSRRIIVVTKTRFKTGALVRVKISAPHSFRC